MCLISLLLKPEYLVNLLPFTAGILGAIVGFYLGIKNQVDYIKGWTFSVKRAIFLEVTTLHVLCSESSY